MAASPPPIAVDPIVVQAIYGFTWVTTIVLGYVVWRHRSRTGARSLLVAMVGAWVWTGLHFLNTFLDGLAVSRLLVSGIYVGVVIAVAGIFLFALEYTGREHLITRRTIALLAIEPAIVVPLALVNPGNVFFESLTPAPHRAIGVDPEFAVGFFVHTLYSYAVVFVASALVIGLIYRTRAMYRGQLAVLAGAVLLPLIPNAMAIAQLVNFDATPLGFLVANGLYTVAITRYRLIDLAPIARDRVVENLNDAVFVVDADDRIVDVNGAGVALTETFVGETDPVGKDVRDLLGGVPEIASLYDDITVDGEGDEVEYEIGGGHFTAEATPVEGPRNRHVGWLFVIRDVTEQRHREERLRERNEQLDEFASLVSHDLRNPLQVAAARIELADQTDDTDHLPDALDAVDRMEAIIDDALALARAEDGVTDLAPVALQDAATTAWATVEAEGATLSVDTDARVTADRDQLVRLLENLFRNAVEHGRADATAAQVERGPDGGVTPPLSITVDVLRRDGRPVGFAVADDGPGIPPEDRECVFESGYSTNADGTGFGLTIVEQIAEAHGWSVAVDESEDGGARFEIAGAEIVND